MLHLKRFDEGVWFDFPGAEGVRLKIKPISLKESMDIRSSVRRKVALSAGGEERIVDDYDESQALWKIFSLCLQDWEGISFDPPATSRDQMLRAIFEHPGLRDFVFEKSRMVTSTEMKSVEEELKNSESSESGSPSVKK